MEQFSAFRAGFGQFYALKWVIPIKSAKVGVPHATLVFVMQLCDVFLSQGESGFSDLLRRISISRLRTYQIYEHIKVRTRLTKLNGESLRKSGYKLWERLQARDEDLATDLSQAILVSQLEMIIAALDFLGIRHQDGFFAKDADVSAQLTEGWQQRLVDHFQDQYPLSVLVFYVNHLGVETAHAEALFTPAAA